MSTERRLTDIQTEAGKALLVQIETAIADIEKEAIDRWLVANMARYGQRIIEDWLSSPEAERRVNRVRGQWASGGPPTEAILAALRPQGGTSWEVKE